MKRPLLPFLALLTVTALPAAPMADGLDSCCPTANAADPRTTAKSKTEKSIPPAAPQQPAPPPSAPAPRRDPPAPPPHLFM